MPAGRPRKPNELHLLEGTARGDRGTDVLVDITGGLAEKPVLKQFEDGIDRDVIFETVRGFVNKVSGQAKVDELILSQLVDYYEIYAICKKDVQDQGIMLQGEKGAYTNPQLYNMNKALDVCHKLMREFGLTPATRGQVKASNQLDSDPLDSLMMGPR